MTTTAPAQALPKRRLASLDQFRGFAIFAMVLVNYLGKVAAMPEAFRHHHSGVSFADIVVPLFLFAVGVGYRLSFLRRRQEQGLRAARWAAVRRNVLLIVIGYCIYGGRYTMAPLPVVVMHAMWDALVQIGMAGLLMLPVIERGLPARVGLGLFWCALFQAVWSHTGYGAWVDANSFNGGPLGGLTHVMPLVAGTIGADLLAAGDHRRLVSGLLAMGLAGLGAGWLLSLQWPLSLHSSSASYLIWSAGACSLIYLAFYLLVDVAGRTIPTFTALGRNALTLYLIQEVLVFIHVLPPQAPASLAVVGWVVLYALIYGVARYLDREGYYVHL